MAAKKRSAHINHGAQSVIGLTVELQYRLPDADPMRYDADTLPIPISILFRFLATDLEQEINEKCASIYDSCLINNRSGRV